MQKPDPSSIPLSPGVYLYRDGKGQVIYVGKARILRRRVLSYFRPEGLPAKTKAMLAHAQSIEFLTTTTEKEALLLEASLIKKYRPHYNIVLRDDKQYVLFRVNIKHPFPRLEVVRKARRDGARYFGPFTSSLAARETWKLLHRAFPLRRCSDRAMKNRVRPCLYHHMGQCPAPCMGLVTAEDYFEGVRRVCDLLQGKADPLLKELHSRMEAAAEALENQKEISLEYTIANTDRACGAMLSGTIAAKYGEAGLPEHTLNVKFKGSAGQSFGAFLVPGVSFKLEGEANDYLGKGLSGGRIAVLPPVRSNFQAEKNTIAGNTLLYGATSGEVYINGRVGERFAVRNSGAIAVVEGVGDHCCEYMTGGRVVVLGSTGRNFAAGMSGGVAYVWNKDGNFDYFCNMEMVELSLIEEASYRKELHELIRQHYLYTGSNLARIMLDDWNRYVDEFIQIVPIEYKKVLQEEQMRKLQQKIAEMQRDY